MDFVAYDFTIRYAHLYHDHNKLNTGSNVGGIDFRQNYSTRLYWFRLFLFYRNDISGFRYYYLQSEICFNA
jgi:hypothetical protein